MAGPSKRQREKPQTFVCGFCVPAELSTKICTNLWINLRTELFLVSPIWYTKIIQAQIAGKRETRGINMGLFSKPEVVIAKESSNAKEYLRQLEELAEKAAGENAKKIAKEIAVVKAGIIGEDNILFELKNSGMDMVVLHDLYIESVSGASAQIDFLVLTPKINFVLECKNLFGNIEINSKGDFIRTIRCGGRYYKEGIYSPITQNQRHLQVLNECRNENHGKVMAALRNHWFSNFFKGLIVLSNPKTIINDQDAPQEVKKQVVRADQLVETIKRMNRESSELKSSMKDLKEDGEYYLNKMHIEKPITYIEKFKQEELEDQPAAEQPALIEPAKPELPEKNLCPKCGKPLVMREARRGTHIGEKFWGCTGFPQCHFIKKIVKTENS
ncbi:NERD domain-containing protein [Agathobaculum sp.]|uniref:nuclease-related domain-containing protein n=1 Tax=Agathobaculum sp. TaxID=2048138 RepID=UPI003A8D80C1